MQDQTHEKILLKLTLPMTEIFRDKFRIQSNKMELFAKWLAVFAKKLYYRCLTRSSISLWKRYAPQPAFTCSKLIVEILEQDLKYVQS